MKGEKSMAKKNKKTNEELLDKVLAYDFNPYKIEDESFAKPVSKETKKLYKDVLKMSL